MIIAELYDMFEEYSKLIGSSKFDIEDICVEQMIKVDGTKGFHFLYGDYIYDVTKNTTSTSRYSIYVRLHSLMKPMIRKAKIEKLLNG